MLNSEGPLQRYRQRLTEPDFQDDPAQLRAVEQLDALWRQLQQKPRWWRRRPPVHGLYLWGPVGRGKTMLMDLFTGCLPADQGLRLHFHHFMKEVHGALLAASGRADPLAWVADRFAERARVLCFDEFYVDNIGDAMLLGRLLRHLFARKVVLVATSNQPPAGLYPDGLHRDRFLPAIELLEQQLTQVDLAGPQDHRRRQLTARPNIFVDQPEALAGCFHQLSDQRPARAGYIELNSRTLPCLAAEEHCIWFHFEALCSGPRSALDYIALAERYESVLVSGVPLLYGERREWIKARGTEDGARANSTGERQVCWAAQDDPARRFISLVDELYDRQVKLYIEAAAPAAQLYPADGALAFQYQRTLSRLIEMGSLEYQQQPARRSETLFSPGGRPRTDWYDARGQRWTSAHVPE
ncbi:cell division protein ZapE [Marinobacterium arenosum]|uniref:cell division protein ZapE n=1 Tax=Marinobacterium arenosum TaxID=2862496 RepID=UPI001C975369|nr:cell division protein ZapE [Marinobacterium arenosum]MBY4678257.1 AFG1 family ATPase [Marinobacterium arenosum]